MECAHFPHLVDGGLVRGLCPGSLLCVQLCPMGWHRAGWLGGVRDVAWSLRDCGWFLPKEASARRLWYTACWGEAYGALSGEAAGCFCPRRAIHSSAKGTVMQYSAVRINTSLLTSFRKKLINLSAIRPETTTVVICSDPLPVLNVVCTRVDLLGEKKLHSWVKSSRDVRIFFHSVC